MTAAPFITDDFLLQSDAAHELYHTYAKPEPILDYHCHLPPKQIADNHTFRNLFEIWLAGDHYKWRAMRANGVAEDFCTGGASDWEKCLAYMRTVPYTLRNPLYHWSHLELQRYFGIGLPINEANAAQIWDEANAKIGELSAHRILEKFQVRALCTTDDPADPLTDHERIRASGLPTRVYPTFRPDKALAIDRPAVFNPWLDKLRAVSDNDCASFEDFLAALDRRHFDFHQIGGRLSDHGMETCLAEDCTQPEAGVIYDRALSGGEISPADAAKFGSFMMVFFGQLDAARGWTKQLHLGAQRNNNSRLFAKLGPDTGFDSIGDFPQARALGRYLDKLDSTDELPKTILYNLDPANNYVFAAMIANFQDGSRAGKIQFGSGWWFLDQKEAIEWQLNALSNNGLLRRFVGMLTDSRSFLSYPRHEYFRRVLCNLLGADMEKGELPRDMELVGAMVREICFANARDYLGLELAVGQQGM